MRRLGATGETFRVRVTYPFKKAGTAEPYVSYLGPYATLGTARGVVTRERKHARATAYAVERATTNWEEVPE